MLTKSNKNFKLILCNARGLKNKFQEFKNEIVDFHEHPEMIAVTETWFSKDVPSDMFSLNMYSEYRRDRKTDSYGGVAFYVRHDNASELVCSVDANCYRTYLGRSNTQISGKGFWSLLFMLLFMLFMMLFIIG